MTSILTKILGINWRTTTIGISSLIAALAIILTAWRTRDFSTIFTQVQTLGPIVVGLLTGLGFLAAKDNNTTGVGANAKKVDSDGTVTRADGTVTPPVA